MNHLGSSQVSAGVDPVDEEGRTYGMPVTDVAAREKSRNILRAGSLCTGILGLDMAVEAFFGCELAWCSEIEEAPARVIERHRPGVPNLGDLTVIDWHDVEPVDVLTGGYPCQPWSHAGKRKGSSDERHLWPYILEALRVLRPRYGVFENVAGHLSLGFREVLESLAEAGFDAEWRLLRASDVGAPHRRARLFFVVADADADADAEHDAERSRVSRGLAGEKGTGQGERTERQRVRSATDQSGATSTDADRLARTTAFAGDRRPGAVGEPGAVKRAQRLRGMAPPDPLGHEQGSEPGERSVRTEHHGDEGTTASVGGDRAVDWAQYEPAIRRWERVLGRPAPDPVDADGRLEPAFVEWLMGYPEGWVDGLTRTQALKALGNAVVSAQAFAALETLVPAFCDARRVA